MWCGGAVNIYVFFIFYGIHIVAGIYGFSDFTKFYCGKLKVSSMGD